MTAIRTLTILPMIALCSMIKAQQADSIYIASYKQKFRVTGYLSTSSVQIDDGNTHYTPNYPLTTGVGIAIKNTIVSVDVGYGFIPLKNNHVYGRSKMTDFQIHRYGRRSIVDLYFQNYQGFYTERKSGRIDGILPNMRVTQMGAEYTFLWNGNQFSSKAAFDLNEIQKRSAGSWLVGGGSYYSNLKGIDPDKTGTGSHFENFQLGLNGGYTYSWVLSDRWMLTAMAKGGANFGNTPPKLGKGKLEIFPTAYARFAANYHKNDWGVSMSVLINNKSIAPVTQQAISMTAITMQLSYVKHIDHLFKRNKKAGVF